MYFHVSICPNSQKYLRFACIHEQGVSVRILKLSSSGVYVAGAHCVKLPPSSRHISPALPLVSSSPSPSGTVELQKLNLVGSKLNVGTGTSSRHSISQSPTALQDSKAREIVAHTYNLT